MIEPLLLALKWAIFGNAIFMLVWMGYRITFHHPVAWVLFDAVLAVASVLVAERYRDSGV